MHMGEKTVAYKNNTTAGTGKGVTERKSGLCVWDENCALDDGDSFARHHNHTVSITSC